MIELYSHLYSLENLTLAFQKARKHKTTKPEVIEFESNLQENLQQLRLELLLHSYRPHPLKTFIIRDPKTRKISKSAFRDRVVHHALCNIIEPLFEKSFIYDSYANRRGKGTLKAIHRLEFFSRKASCNYTRRTYVLKADIYHYFDCVDQKILLKIIQKKIKCPKIIWLIRLILSNYYTEELRGMPLGNLTSQFFANVYLNELDQFVKHQLKAEYYVRYVDDFVLLHHSPLWLEEQKQQIGLFLQEKLSLKLHPQKTKERIVTAGINFLGMRVFSHYRLLLKKNFYHFQRKYSALCQDIPSQKASYDQLYDFMEGWLAYTKQANTYKLRKNIIANFEHKYSREISIKEFNRGRNH